MWVMVTGVEPRADGQTRVTVRIEETGQVVEFPVPAEANICKSVVEMALRARGLLQGLPDQHVRAVGDRFYIDEGVNEPVPQNGNALGSATSGRLNAQTCACSVTDATHEAGARA